MGGELFQLRICIHFIVPIVSLESRRRCFLGCFSGMPSHWRIPGYVHTNFNTLSLWPLRLEFKTTTEMVVLISYPRREVGVDYPQFK
jgi:hypothetical protein